MRIKKRNGSLEPCDVNKIVRAIARCSVGLDKVDSMRVAMRTIAGLHDGATTEELDRLSIQTAGALVVEEPEYSRLAARLLAYNTHASGLTGTTARLCLIALTMASATPSGP